MWLKTEKLLIDLSKITEVQLSQKSIVFIYADRNTVSITKNSPEAAQALFEHVAALLEAKE